MNDDLERTLRDSLDRHAVGVARPTGHLDDVYVRVDRRRARHRAYAVVGSLAIVGVGVVGIAALAAGDDNRPAVGDAAFGGDAPTTTISVLGQTPSAWSCAGYLGSDGGGRDLYSDCYPAAVGDGSAGVCAPTTTTTTTTTVPMSSEPPMPADVAASAWPADCGPLVAPAWADPACQVLPSSTTAPPDAAFVEASPIDTCAPAPTTTTMLQLVATTTSVVWEAPPPTSPVEQSYVVAPGDSLNSISARFGIEPGILANYNAWPDFVDHVLLVDDVILVPPGAIVPGD